MKSRSSSYNKGCPDQLSASCVTWNGPNIPSLGITNGDTLTETVFIIAKKVCSLANQLDLSTLDISCLLNLCEDCQIDKGLKNILQLILDNQCSLKVLIDAINPSGGSDITLTLNMRCLKKFDEFNNEIPQDLNMTLQSIVNQVCDSKDAITALQVTVNDLQNQIDGIDVTPTVTLPNVTNCISTNKPLNTAVNELAADYCAYKETVGPEGDIQDAVGHQTPNLQTKIGNPDGFISSPANMAQSFTNLWLAYTNLLTRVELMESTCCKPSCDNISIGFLESIVNETVILSFTSGAGTDIPSIFTDCGSSITITNATGTTTFTANITIAQEGDTQPIDLSSFTKGETLTFVVNAKMCTDGLTCQRCITKQIRYIDSDCCVITNTSNDDITITYQTAIAQPSG